jgi:hypothetical protein
MVFVGECWCYIETGFHGFFLTNLQLGGAPPCNGFFTSNMWGKMSREISPELNGMNFCGFSVGFFRIECRDLIGKKWAKTSKNWETWAPQLENGGTLGATRCEISKVDSYRCGLAWSASWGSSLRNMGDISTISVGKP